MLAPDRSAIPALLYHGLGAEGGFSDPADAEYGVDAGAFAEQMASLVHAGYRTVGLETFVAFVRGEPVELPPRPLLLTFDDARADSWTGADGVLRELGLHAVMFVDVGRVDAGEAEYLTWPRLAGLPEGGRWDVQLHAGRGHEQIRHGPGADDVGPAYAYRRPGETFAAWRTRVRTDVEWAQRTLSAHVPAYRPLAFAVPYGNYGQEGTNDPRIPGDLLGWLARRYGAVFTQDVNARARPGSGPPLGRIQVTRATAGGDLHHMLLSGEH